MWGWVGRGGDSGNPAAGIGPHTRPTFTRAPRCSLQLTCPWPARLHGPGVILQVAWAWVFVHVGCYEQVSENGVAYQQQTCISQSFVGGKSKVMSHWQHGWALVRALFWFAGGQLLTASSCSGQRVGWPPWPRLIRALIPSWGRHPPALLIFQGPHLHRIGD